MEIREARFLMSNTKLEQMPEPKLPEFAFIGRSNVGKSSLINMLTQQKGLAKTSSKPGKTQTINHFLINNAWYLADLPGYGWAQASKTDKARWQASNEEYLLGRPNLACVLVLLDSRREEPQGIDLDFLEGLGENGIPVHLVFTKTDKLSSTAKETNIARFLEEMKESWEPLPGYTATSAVEQSGREELLAYLEHALGEVAPYFGND